MSRVGLFLRAAANALLAGVLAPTREQQAEAAAKAVRDHFGKKSPRRMSDITDPYFGIKSKGRTGARKRAALMAEAAPPKPERVMSNPFKREGRRAVFDKAICEGNPDAMLLARAVPLGRKKKAEAPTTKKRMPRQPVCQLRGLGTPKSDLIDDHKRKMVRKGHREAVAA